jgi:5-methylcytosine-specific restriction enzyme B
MNEIARPVGSALEPQLFNELKAALDKGLASGQLMTPSQITQQLDLFRARYGLAVLRDLDGEALLRLMHGRQDSESRCLAYWLEFKHDEEFSGFGGIGGGAALKFGIYQRQSDHAWVGGSAQAQKLLLLDEAVARARDQRDELLAGADVLGAMDASDTSDEAYRRLQAEMEKAAPNLSGVAWAHKYWFLTNPELDFPHFPARMFGSSDGPEYVL